MGIQSPAIFTTFAIPGRESQQKNWGLKAPPPGSGLSEISPRIRRRHFRFLWNYLLNNYASALPMGLFRN